EQGNKIGKNAMDYSSKSWQGLYLIIWAGLSVICQ
ncbi:MAG: hypothetical protein ACJAR3_002246, partial [Roseivirga sp.]